jgi:hypothetical protein
MDLAQFNECLKNMYPNSEIHYEIDARYLPNIDLSNDPCQKRRSIYVYSYPMVKETIEVDFIAPPVPQPQFPQPQKQCYGTQMAVPQFAMPQYQPQCTYENDCDVPQQECLKNKKRLRKAMKHKTRVCAHPPTVQYDFMRAPCK